MARVVIVELQRIRPFPIAVPIRRHIEETFNHSSWQFSMSCHRNAASTTSYCNDIVDLAETCGGR